ncbi:MAG: MATE family efflux transporter [Clostridia bacterium]|nr:MATE family efflux transporter [Clostridia bacterium]
MSKIKMFLMGKKSEADMTKGSIAGNIIMFALPLLAGNLFQQLYNMVDTLVIGKYGETGEYAAVGSVAPVINILIGLFMGLSSGAGVVISQFYGAKKDDKVRDAVHTSVAMTLIMGVVFTVIGVLMTPFFLKIMLSTDTAEELMTFEYAKTYLTIYFSGVMGLMIYNMCSGIMRAVGDSRRPFYFLIVSSVVNIILDLVFVTVFDMGVAGVALATVIAQWCSAIIAIITLLRTTSCVKIVIKRIKLHFELLGKIVGVGIPAALQMALTSFSNMFVQSYVAGANGVQDINLGAWTSYSKIDQFLFLPTQSISLAATTFVAQNMGIANEKRARKGVRISVALSASVTTVLIVLVMTFSSFFASIFKNDNEEIVKLAAVLLRYITPFYICTCINQIFAAVMRGAGNSRVPMLIMLSTFVGLRQIYLFTMSNFISNDLINIGMGYPCGWVACSIAMLVYYKFFFKYSANKIVE